MIWRQIMCDGHSIGGHPEQPLDTLFNVLRKRTSDGQSLICFMAWITLMQSFL
jgi:hypothetical protein